MNEFKVSVITPVYNAEKYLRKAVESAVHLDEVGEIILVEDKSPDNALQVCLSLEKGFDKVYLYQHPDKRNHGAGASRNLGIEKATCEFVAFLDADDYYLPNRFEKDKEIFLENLDVEGVYNAIGIHYYSEKAKQQFLEAGYRYQEFLTISDKVAPDDLFKVLFHAHPTIQGEFSTDSITLRKKVFEKVGYFNTKLRLQQDIHLWRRLAAFCKLKAGEIKNPVAIRGVHEENRITRKEDHKQYLDLWWKSLYKEFKKKQLEKNKFDIFRQAYYNYYSGNPNKLIAIKALLASVINQPSIIKQNFSHFDLNFLKVFGRNWLSLHVISAKNKLFKKTNSNS